MRRFVILEHDWPFHHWDFLLEAGTVLRAWRLLAEPTGQAQVPAEANFDHRPLYLEFEGRLSGERGSVKRWDMGIFEWLEDTPARVTAELHGEKLIGRATISINSDGTGTFRLVEKL